MVTSRDELHQLIDALDDDIIVPALHTLVDTLPDQTVPTVLGRLKSALEHQVAIYPRELLNDSDR
jgi:hypothetical protein